MNDKTTGSFYTPVELVKYMVSYIKNRVKLKAVLEPSIGDGRFVEELLHISEHIKAIEISDEKISAKQNEKRWPSKITFECADFIQYALDHNEKYDLIIGNPPYISKKNLPKEQRVASQQLVETFGLSDSLFQNSWVSFILAALKLLSSEGTIFYILPFEFLQVQYAEKLRNFLEVQFNTIEIITFEERVFKDIEQDICLVFLSNEQEEKAYIKYTTLKSPATPKLIFNSVIMRNKPLKKWSNCILNDDETEFIHRLAKKYSRIGSVGNISPGIVTGANSFFIVEKNQLSDFKMDNIKLEIISKSSDIIHKFIFTKEDFDELSQNNKKTYLINLNDINKKHFSPSLLEYLDQGEKQKINERYKCLSRNRWFDVPIVKNGAVCFFKRYSRCPRIIVNEALVHTTDIAYNIRFFDGYEPKSFAFCFYNSLTLALCEYYGRFYGGGVGELVPSEFKSLAIPYVHVDPANIEHVNQMIQNQENIEKIIDFVDDVVLNLCDHEKILLQKIRHRFLRRRLNGRK